MAANAPVFFLHPRESYFPCTVEWFLHRAQLCVMRSVLLSRRVQRGAAPVMLITRCEAHVSGGCT